MFGVVLKDVFTITYEEFPEPTLENMEEGVIVQIDASGICGSDMHRYSGEEPIVNNKKICGHELGGTIIEKSPGVRNFELGQKVAVNPTIPCLKCYYCKNDLTYLCEQQKWIPAMTERVFVPERSLVAVPESFDTLYTPLFEPAAAAIHTCDGIKNSNVLLIGIGTVGLFLLQLLKKNNNVTLAADISEYALNQAQRIGTEHVVDLSDDQCDDQIRNIFGDEKIDYVIDAVGITPTVNRGIHLVKKRGVVRIVGASRTSIHFDCRTALLKEITIESIYIYPERDYRRAASMIVNDELEYQSIVSKVFPLNMAKEAFAYKQNTPSTKVLLSHK